MTLDRWLTPLAMVLATASVGCSTTTYVHGGASEGKLNSIHTSYFPEPVTVEAVSAGSATKLQGTLVGVGPTHATIQQPGGQSLLVDNNDIRRLTVPQPSSAGLGAPFGFLLGGVATGTVVMATYTNTCGG